jgi:hypothetical protein
VPRCDKGEAVIREWHNNRLSAAMNYELLLIKIGLPLKNSATQVAEAKSFASRSNRSPWDRSICCCLRETWTKIASGGIQPDVAFRD